MENLNMEQKLQDLINQQLVIAIDCLKINHFTMDKNGTYINRNASLTNIVGDIAQGNAVNEEAWRSCQKVMEKGERIVIEEVHQDKTFLSVKAPLIIDNEVIGVTGISIDISEQKKAEQAKTEFIRNMSHDIRTPLVGVFNMAKLLHDDEEDPYKKECLSDIVQSSERLSALLNQVIEITTLGNCPVQYGEYNINEIVNEIIGSMVAAVRAKGLALDVNCPDSIVNTDKFRISRILLNLLSNAVKFTDQGSIHVEVKANPKLKIIVKDTGIGIPENKFNIIFDKFSKLIPSHHYQHFSGSGIGLYIAKQFAQELGGDISVQSMLGKGSSFCYTQL